MKINFEEASLVAIYGSWAKVQVAFYDFLFETALSLCPAHFNEMALEQKAKEFQDEGDFYEEAIAQIEKAFPSPDQAWEKFIQEQQK